MGLIIFDRQVDASILLTANVPSAKKIIVHGPQVRIPRNSCYANETDLKI
jgi:hypothetical protein